MSAVRFHHGNRVDLSFVAGVGRIPPPGHPPIRDSLQAGWMGSLVIPNSSPALALSRFGDATVGGGGIVNESG